MSAPSQAGAVAALLPCPFCGACPSPPRKDGGSDERNGYNFQIIIRCRCSAEVRAHSHENSGGWCDDTGQALALATSVWNKRATQPAAVSVEALEGLVTEWRKLAKTGTFTNGSGGAFREALNDCADELTALIKERSNG